MLRYQRSGPRRTTKVSGAPRKRYGGVVPSRAVRENARERALELVSKGPLLLPAIPPLPATTNTRQVSLNEVDSETVRVSEVDGNIVLDCEGGEPFGPKEALLGTLGGRRRSARLGRSHQPSAGRGSDREVGAAQLH